MKMEKKMLNTSKSQLSVNRKCGFLFLNALTNLFLLVWWILLYIIISLSTYELALAPEGSKETATQHPRADASQAISSNIQCLTVSASAAPWNFSSEETPRTLSGRTIPQAYSATTVPQTHSAHVASEEESK
nr:hypothetical protein CFP56_33116 [Quercus suber]